jgi:2-polyprenyl-3-methyl-5-hydroxy-6-metoxy-1,4-benzoquinol methylase/uncharacterized protein YbaR (Trm112 family)
MSLDRWFLEHLRCPVDLGRLSAAPGVLVSAAGRRYPVVDGVPVMLRDDVEQTHWVAQASLERARCTRRDERAEGLYLESLGVDDADREAMLRLQRLGPSAVDPVVSCIVAHTGGRSYRPLRGRLARYPIPDLRLPVARGAQLLDVGCNWGRFSIAAARKGYDVVGIDPSLGGIMAARRVARQLELPIRYLVADARFLPFGPASFDVVFSYSVLQHFSEDDLRSALASMARVLRPGGRSQVQMAHALGLRSLQQQLRRGFREPRDFAVRYRRMGQIERTFSRLVGPSRVSVDCFFGLGLQGADAPLLPWRLRMVVRASELLRRASAALPWLARVADSVYVDSTRAGE